MLYHSRACLSGKRRAVANNVMSSTANRTPSPGAAVTTPDRDHAADSDDSLARKRLRLSEDPEVVIEADEPEDIGADMDTAILIEDDALDAGAYSATFTFFGDNYSPFDALNEFQRLVAGDGTYFLFRSMLLRHHSFADDDAKQYSLTCNVSKA